MTFGLAIMTLILNILSGALVIHVEAFVMEMHSNSDDHFNSGPMLLGPIPIGI